MCNPLNWQTLSGFDRTNAVSNLAGYLGSFHPTSHVAKSARNSFRSQRSNNAGSLKSFQGVVNQQLSDVPRPASVSQHPPAAQNARTQPRKREAPCMAMFPNAPSADHLLSTSALIDDDQILDHFPQYLSSFDVMKRFVKGYTTRSGGYATKDMMNKLLRHVSGKDDGNTCEEQRRRNLDRWIVKEKYSRNAKLRAARSSSVSTAIIVAQSAATSVQRSSAQAGDHSFGGQELSPTSSTSAIATTGQSLNLHHASMQRSAAFAHSQHAYPHLDMPIPSGLVSITSTTACSILDW